MRDVNRSFEASSYIQLKNTLATASWKIGFRPCLLQLAPFIRKTVTFYFSPLPTALPRATVNQLTVFQYTGRAIISGRNFTDEFKNCLGKERKFL